MSELGSEMLPPEQLAERVFNLPAYKFLTVYRLYEQLGRQKDVDAEMQVLRGRLRRLRPRRAQTFTRLLCLPFEAFIDDSVLPGPYLVPRRHCALLGRFVASLMDPAEVDEYHQAIARIPVGDTGAMLKVGGGFWRKAAQSLRAAEIRHRKSRRGSLRDSIELIAGCLDVGPQMASLTMGLPNERFRQLDVKAKELVGRSISSVPESRLDDLLYPMVLLALRLETPPAVVSLLQDQTIDIPPGKRAGLIKMISRYLEMDLQAEVTVVEEIAQEPAREGPRALLQDLLPSIQKALANRSAGVGSVPAQLVMETAGDIVRDQIVAPAPDVISERLDELLSDSGKTTGDGGVHTLDLDRIRQFGSIEDELTALSDLLEHADSLGLRQDIRIATDAARTRIDETANNLIGTLDQVTSSEDIMDCRRNVYGMVRMIELLEGSDKADQLRIRCNDIVAGKSAAA